MRYATIISVLSIGLPLVHASTSIKMFKRQDSCSANDQDVCDDFCMTPGAVCCNEGTGAFCDAGQVCLPGGCCDEGDTCTGQAGTQTVDLFSTTADASEPFTTEDAETSTEEDTSTAEETSADEETTAVATRTAGSGSSASRTPASAPGTTRAQNTGGGASGTGSAPQSTGGASGYGYVAGLPGLAFVAGQLVLAL